MLTFRKQALQEKNTFGIAATATRFADVDDETQLREWCETSNTKEPPILIGGGSNLVFTRDVIDAPMLHIAPRGIRVIDDDADSVVVEAMSGEPWHAFVMWCLENGFSGIENLALIPGYVGAAPVQNIGAYGVEMKDCCEGVTAVDTATGALREYSAAECEFGYRDSVFKRLGSGEQRDRCAITRVRFRLSRRFRAHLSYGEIQSELAAQSVGATDIDAAAVARAVIAIRTRKLPDPRVLGNAGSFFKNPVISPNQAEKLRDIFPDVKSFAQGDAVKIAAGWLIEKTGWKGKRRGAVGVHANHALVLVNYGGGTGAEIGALARAIIEDVEEKSGILLEPEPRIV